MKWECSACDRRYDDEGMPPMTAPPKCRCGKGNKQKVMVKRDEYQCILDDLGIAADDPLRFAE